MPKKKLYLQISFEQGMVDTIVTDYDYQDSDLKWQAPQSRSALYIENYDPTIVKGALTKRYGYAVMRVQSHVQGSVALKDQSLWNWAMAGPYPDDYNFNYQMVDINKYTNLIDNDPNPSEDYNGFAFVQSQDAITVCGATVVPYNRPLSQNVLVLFVRDIENNALTSEQEEHTRIVHYGQHLPKNNYDVARWRNSLIDGLSSTGKVNHGGPREPSIYPGWDVRGTFSDAARHGGTLVVTTNVAKDYYPWQTLNGTAFTYTQAWVSEMYPCYVWTFWDLRRKRYNRKFWQVISDGATTVSTLADLTQDYDLNDKYSQFKVLYPSQAITRNKTFLSWRAYSTGTNVLINASADSAGDLSQAIAANNVAHNLLNVGPQNSSVEVSIVETRGRTFTTTPEVWYNDSNPSDDELAVASEYAFLNRYLTHVKTIEVPKNYAITRTDNEYWRTTQDSSQGPPGYRIEEITVTEGTLVYNGNRQRPAKLIGKPLLSSNKGDQIVANGKTGDDAKQLSDNAIFWTVGISLPNYLEANAPRPWLHGEQIPLALTATIRGAEVFVGSYVHTVSGQDYDPYPSMCWPAPYWFNYTFGQLPGSQSGNSVPRDKSKPELYPNLITGYIGFTGPAVHGNAVSEQYYLLLDSNTKFNGRYVLVGTNRGFALQESTTFPAGGSPVRYRAYEQYEPYCIEPFNPTQNAPYVASPGQYNAVITAPPYSSTTIEHRKQILFHRPVPMSNAGAIAVNSQTGYGDNNGVAGYRKGHTNPRLIFVTVKIDKSALGMFLDQGIESLNLYCAQPSEESALHSVGLSTLEDPTAGIYMLPDIPSENEYSKYRLVKRFVLDGDGEPFHNYRNAGDIQYWKDNYYGTPINTNSWVEKDTFLLATGQHKTDVANTNAGLQLTPDFILWDYPVSTTMNLNSTGKYWQGRGAGLVANIKGRTFLSGCIDQYGEEEQSIIRYSDVQNGIITLDLFSEENFIRVGGLPHVALCEYREQLWVFSRTEVHRIQMPDVVTTATWEYLDKTPGQGTFNNKTVITLPNGVAWCNESGVWLSDGRIPQNLAEPVLTFYKTMATNNPPYYSTKITLPKFPTDYDGINPYLELSYDEFKNELVVVSPSVEYVGFNDAGNEPYQRCNEEWRLIYSFGQNVWRIEQADLPAFGTYLNEFDAEGKVSFVI